MKFLILISCIAGGLGAKLKHDSQGLGAKLKHDSQGFWETASSLTNLGGFLQAHLTVDADSERNDCLPGFVHNSSTGKCSDIDECALKNHSCAATNPCANTVGSYHCMCSKGYAGSLPLCVDIDECKIGNHTCKNVAQGINCTNTLGSFECTCRGGWENLTHVNNVPRCVLANECTNGQHNCHENATCLDTPGSFVCACKAGYGGNGTFCTDVDECQTSKCHHLTGTECNNTDGSFECVCRTGYNGTDGNCSNIDECADNTTHNCNSSASCIDNEGSFFCKCNPGYIGNGLNCSDENECTNRPINCQNGPVGAFKCNNTVGSFECLCQEGWNQSAVDQTCENINECLNETICNNETSVCVDNPGSFRCNCKPGFFFNASIHECQDIDECAFGNHRGCTGSGQVCKNLNGSYECGCGDGFVNQSNLTNASLNCTNKDECASGGGSNCHSDATCVDGFGSFSCGCNTGFIGDGVSCTGYDVCMLKKDNCSKDATCAGNASAGTFTCTCKPGYHGNGTHCYDADECHDIATANDTHGGNDCGSNATCTNIKGSFLCVCNAGYAGDGKTCENVDECSMRIDNCWVNSNCTDTDGSFDCPCLPGYNNTFGNTSCTDLDECMVNWYNRSNNGSNNGTAEHVCHANATCVNTVGSFACSCKPGFTRDPSLDSANFSCIDVDECNVGLHDCNPMAYCSNTFGSFTCRCKPGYTGTGNNTNCVNINECTTAPWFNATMNHTACDPAATCTDTVGSFMCKCKVGFTGDGKTCSNIDECALGVDNCYRADDWWNCTDTTGSFTCRCPHGYFDVHTTNKSVPNGTQCASYTKMELGIHQATKLGWQKVSFRSGFSQTPVVVMMVPTTGGREVYARVKDITKKSFKVALSYPSTGNKTKDDGFKTYLKGNLPSMSYLAVIKGKHTMPDGTIVNAGEVNEKGRMQRTTSCTLDKDPNPLAYWTKVKFPNYNNTPAVFAQIQGMSSIRWKGGLLKNKFCTSGVQWDERVKQNDSLAVARICKGKAGAVFDLEEKLAWIVIAANVSNFTNEKNNRVHFESWVGTRNLQGGGVAEDMNFSSTFNITNEPIVLANKVTVSDRVMGWMQFEKVSSNGTTFRILEDECDLPPAPREEYVNMFVASAGFSV